VGVTATVAALVGDLMFLSRIREAARASGLEVRAIRGGADLPQAVRGAALALVDLDDPRLGIQAVATLRGHEETAAIPIVGFFSHVHAARGRDAREAGCTEALPRSAFIERLPAILGEAGRA
jgi:CheY-like chemotaxis protein